MSFARAPTRCYKTSSRHYGPTRAKMDILVLDEGTIYASDEASLRSRSSQMCAILRISYTNVGMTLDTIVCK